MIVEFLIILGSIWVACECCAAGFWIVGYVRSKKREFPSYTPAVSVIVPCRGTGHGFYENIQAFLRQEYPRYQILFVVDSRDDPAHRVLEQLTKDKPNAHLALTRPFFGCSGKIAALLTGLASTADAEVLVFADSDMKPDTHWLRNLVAPLQDETIGATTGYRWYFPTDWKTLLISVWNMISMVCLFYPSPTWVWGGSTAIRKNVFDKLRIKEKWKTAISDDCVVTKSVKKARYTIYFEPRCIMESPPEKSIRSFARWGKKQFTWLRWHHPVLWFGAFVGFLGTIIIALGLFLLLLFGYYIPGILLISLILVEMLCGWWGIQELPKKMVYPKERYSLKIAYAIMTPLTFLLIAETTIASALAREIQWTGRSYRKPKTEDLC
jgi:cellulose synthase/poly-beta-1,6-N-acetylglucosamine synthase-like glycosyltransferase